jgi:hypothetical protein
MSLVQYIVQYQSKGTEEFSLRKRKKFRRNNQAGNIDTALWRNLATEAYKADWFSLALGRH